MRRLIAIIAGLSMFYVMAVNATDDPHGSTDAIYCEQCHITHGTMGDILINAADSLVSVYPGFRARRMAGTWIP
jgi:hypothetical protein